MRYKTTISNHSGRMVRVNGLFACEEWPGSEIFQSSFSHMLIPN